MGTKVSLKVKAVQQRLISIIEKKKRDFNNRFPKVTTLIVK